MFKDIIKNEKGIALLLTLSIVAILTAITMQIHYQMSQSMIAASITKDRLALKETAMAGVYAAMGMLAKDRKENDTDSLQEDWAIMEEVNEVLNEIPIEGFVRKVVITDEMSKLQVNALVAFSNDPEPAPHNDHEKIWINLLEAFFAAIEEEEKIDEELKEKIKEKSSPKIITHSLIDWLDPEEEGVYGLGAEYADYYSELDPPYKPKNGPITDIDELILVKGILPEIFSGLGDKSLPNFVTVFGVEIDKNKKFFYPGKVNINTAPREVLIGLLGIENIEIVDDIISFREDTSEESDKKGRSNKDDKDGTKFTNDLSRDKNWYKNIPGFSDLQLEANKKLITTSSDIFKISSRAWIPVDDLRPSDDDGESKANEEDEDNDDEENRESKDKESVKEKDSDETVGTTITAIVQRVQDKKSKKWQCKILKWKTE